MLSAWLVGFKTDQLWLVAIFNACFYFSWATRRLILGFSIFIAYWILFDYMKAFPNYLYNTVHIQDLYEAEKRIFGITIQGIKMTPNEFWLLHKQVWLDMVTGIFYLCWVPVPLGFAAWLFYQDRVAFLHFSFSFLLVNLIGFVFYYIYPAAPPWYVQLRGFEFFAHTRGNAAGLLLFDQHLHMNVFTSLYSKSSNVFAAMPSLHSAYPVIVLYYARHHSKAFFQAICAVVAAGIWFAAIYNSHHYVMDVLAGIICALFTLFLYRKVLMSWSVYKGMIVRYHQLITA